MNKERELELSPTALNPLVGIELYDEKVETVNRTEQVEEE